MNTFYRRSINEYRRQIGLKESFTIQTGRLQTIIESADLDGRAGLSADTDESRRRARLLLLFPLLEIAWADGRVTRRESEAILQVAGTYGLVEDEASGGDLLEKLTSRPIPHVVGRMWNQFYRLFEKLPEPARADIVFCLDVQARFVAEQSSDNLMAFLRGERVCKNERETLEAIRQRLETAQAAAKSLDEKRAAEAAQRRADESDAITASADNYYETADLSETLDDYSKLIPLVPLVKTAWAEGRITRRERHLVFEAANRFGITPGTSAYRRLAEWLELHPTEEFYDSALDILRGRWQKLGAEEKLRRRFDLLDDCTKIAEASGGTNRFPSGGAKICDAEIVAVKRIAGKLDVAAAA